MITIREKRTRSGPLLEVDLYPVFSGSGRSIQRTKTEKTAEAKKRYNDRMSALRFIRTVNANFDGEDYYLHPTYLPEGAPKSEAEARRNVANYLRRVKAARRKEADRLTRQLKALPRSPTFAEIEKDLRARLKLLARPLRCAYSVERVTYRSGVNAGRDNWHHHMFITGGLPPERMERIWGDGVRVNCNRYKPDMFGPEAAARYAVKRPAGHRRYSCTRNMVQPRVTVIDGRHTAAQVERYATRRMDDVRYWERRYRGFKLMRTFPRYDEYNGHWYMTVVLFRSDGSPPRNVSDVFREVLYDEDPNEERNQGRSGWI